MLKDRVVLVTGAGRGIGRAIALAFAAQGSRVAVAARTRHELEHVVDEIEQAGGKTLLIADDLSERAAPGRMVGRVLDAWGPIEVLVNNAGIGSSQQPGPLIHFDDAYWDLTLATNVTAPYLLTKLVLPDMIEAGWGRIINISSINAKIAAMHAAAYVTSKHALAGLTKATALEVADQGITCNAICPGPTATQMNDLRMEYDSARLDTPIEELEAQASPLGRRITPEEIAPLAVFLASDGASAINGQLINVCGGRVMY
jgi:NAD(P)-dependent dehydrogenase (short-subunit alcohol dehydrogenase family)